MKVALALSLTLLVLPAHAWADASRVVLVVPERPELAQLLAAELRALSLEPVVVVATPTDSAEIEALASAESAGASIWIPAGTSVVRIWVADRVTGKTVVRVVPTDDAATLALAATELLRASLLELSLDTHHGAVEPTPAIEALVPAVEPVASVNAPARVGPWLAIEGGVLVHDGGPALGGTGALLAGGPVTDWLDLAGRIGVGVPGPLVHGLEGVDVGTGLAGIRAIGRLSILSNVALTAAVEADLVVCATTGRGALGRTDWALALEVSGALGLRLLADPVWIGLEGGMGAWAPPVEIEHGGQVIGALGRPLVIGRATLGWVL
jgi:hypothetical protein